MVQEQAWRGYPLAVALLSADSALDGRGRRELPDGLLQMSKIDGFRQVDRKAGGSALFDVSGRTKAREGDCGDRTRGAQRPHELDSASIRELDVADQDVEFAVSGSPKRRRHINGLPDRIAACGE